MKIGVNLLNLSQDKFGGVEQYLKNLILHLVKQEKEITLFLFLTNPNIIIFPDELKQIKKVIINKQSIKSYQINRTIRKLQLDLWFCPLHQSYLSDIPVPTVVTIHDVLHTFYPEFVSGGLHENNEYYKKFIPTFNTVITVSEFSKEIHCGKPPYS